MGGKVLELESERLTAKGIQQGMQQGLQQGMQRGIQQGMQQGMKRGIQQGRTEGEERLSVLINRLILDGRSSQIQIIVNDKQAREKAYKEYNI